MGIFFNRPDVSLWVRKAKVHYYFAQLQLGYAFFPHPNGNPTPEGVDAMKNFLVGGNSTFGRVR